MRFEMRDKLRDGKGLKINLVGGVLLLLLRNEKKRKKKKTHSTRGGDCDVRVL